MNNRLRSPGAAVGLYLAAMACMSVSLDTSYRVFGELLTITGAERWGMFAVVEVTLLACANAMRLGVRDHGHPGPIRTVAWAVASGNAVAALAVGGPVGGPLRAGAVFLGLVLLHHALGIELRGRGSQRAGTLARIGRELRERILSRVGLADDQRDAAARTRDRAARRAARLAHAGTHRNPFGRTARLARAIAASNAPHDPAMRARLLAERAALQHAASLIGLDQSSPWVAPGEADAPEVVDHSPVDPAAGRTPAPISEDTFTDGTLDGAVLLAAEPPEWASMSKRAAVARADALLPRRSARSLAVALAQVGIEIGASGVRAARARTRDKANATPRTESNGGARTEAHADTHADAPAFADWGVDRTDRTDHRN